MRPAVFLDRDGTIIKEAHYLRRSEDVTLIPGASGVIRRLNAYDVPVVLISNQSGVGRGYFSDDELKSVQKRLTELLDCEGCHLDAAYFCPHHPDAGCNCRKPSPGMLLQAADELAIDLAKSCMVGDRTSDIEAGRRAGCRVVLVQTGCGRNAAKSIETLGLTIDHIATDLSTAWPWLDANIVGPWRREADQAVPLIRETICEVLRPSSTGTSTTRPRHDSVSSAPTTSDSE